MTPNNDGVCPYCKSALEFIKDKAIEYVNSSYYYQVVEECSNCKKKFTWVEKYRKVEGIIMDAEEIR